MNKRSATEFFRGPERYNCAQAVVKAFQQECAIPEQVIHDYAQKGSGRAEGGLCGALYAARAVLTDPAEIAALEQRFVERAGAKQCREIRRLNKLSFRESVEAAEEIFRTIRPLGRGVEPGAAE